MDKQEFLKQLENQPFSVLGDLVYRYIVDGIENMRFSPGTKLNAKRISEELGISRTPVRTALNRLVEEGLVEPAGEKGFKVSPVDWRDCLSLYDAREMIEGSAAYIAANTITDAQLEQLRRNIQATRRTEDYLEIFELDNQFHALIVQAAGNQYLIDMHRSLRSWMRRYQHALLEAQGLPAARDLRIAEKHKGIYRASQNRYSLVAKTEMERHLQEIYRMLFRGVITKKGGNGGETKHDRA